MMQRWSPDAIRFMADASEYGTYNKDLAAILKPYMATQGHVCDAGCGLGYLAQKLAGYCAEVTAIDRSPAVIEAMKARQLPHNLRVFCEDIFTIDAQFDSMVFCYFGRTDEILRVSQKLCTGNVLIVKRECADHSFSIGKIAHRKHTIEDTLLKLQELKIPYEQRKICLEMGQPFRTMEDAMTFFRLYNKSEQEVELSAVEKRLIKTGQVDFPLYLPNRRAMELIVFSANDLPKGVL